VAYTAEGLTAVNTVITRLMAGDRVVRITKDDQMGWIRPGRFAGASGLSRGDYGRNQCSGIS